MTTNRFTFAQKEALPATKRKKRLRSYMKERRAQNENRDVKELRLVENVFSAFEKLWERNEQSADLACDKAEESTKKEKKTCFCYLSFSSEAPTDKLVERLQEQGFLVCAPRVEGEEMLPVELGSDYALSRFGIREPIGQAYTGEVDVIITPLLAVDEQGNRLGYGGGYYDRFFKKYPKAKRVGYAFDFQIVKEVPIEPQDEKLDCIITEKRIIFVGR